MKINLNNSETTLQEKLWRGKTFYKENFVYKGTSPCSFVKCKISVISFTYVYKPINNRLTVKISKFA